jgi:2-polyprenyl-6-methoxyphenol hydroxylase-like FAD-dependent oxidoreductase
VRATPEFWEYPMCDRDPLPWWTQGRVTLLGDAAHPMYPVGSNGASQAVLDARSLSRLFAGMNVPRALAAYEAERLPATREIVLSNRRGGPERVVDVVSERAPDGFQRIEDVIAKDELAAIAKGYAQMAGFAR